MHTASQAEFEALAECQRSVLGADKKIQSLIYDALYGRWLIIDERADEIIRCLIERHSWIGISARQMAGVALKRLHNPAEPLNVLSGKDCLARAALN